MYLGYHEHICPDCNGRTVHHKFQHEDVGDDVLFWCEHCEEDVEGEIGQWVHAA